MRAEDRLQRGGVRAVAGARHAEHLHPVELQQVEQVVVAGVLHHHHVARLEQRAYQQVEGMAGAGGGEDLLRVDMDIDQPQAFLDVLAQRRQAQRSAVVEQPGEFAAGDLADRVAEFLDFPPTVRNPAAAELEFRRAAAELAPCVFRAFVPFAVEVGSGGGRLGDEEPRAVPRFQHPQGDQAVVGLDHAGLAELVFPGQLAYRRNPRAGADAIAADPAADPCDDLLHQRLAGIAVDPEVHA